MDKLKRGLYETVLTAALHDGLEALPSGLVRELRKLDVAESPDRLTLHAGQRIRRVLEALPEKDRVREGVHLVGQLLTWLHDRAPRAVELSEVPLEPGQILAAVLRRRPDGEAESIRMPLIPLLDTTLLTNAPGEPNVGSQLAAEIASADRIDLIMAFVRLSGLRPLLPLLEKHCDAGRNLRVLTTTYTQSTELRALETLTRLGGDVRVSYDESGTRLHAKAWLFERASGFATAYIGSSNLTHSAQVSGLEWNVRVSAARNPDVTDKVAAVFESYWDSGDFQPFDVDQYRESTAESARGPSVLVSPVELRPEPFQARMLEQIALARQRGHHRNLLVSATGTGKTVMAALDYLALREQLPRARLLFVAHRKEILTQARATFCQALHDATFGELWVDGRRPQDHQHVFASIQSLNATDLEHLAPDHFDVVIVDEFHHAAAASYQGLLEHLQPRELLGLTATPERSDGLPILDWFDHRIAAELRLWDAIDQRRLSPFVYYGIHDGLNLREVPWKRGRGYDTRALSKVVTGNEVWADKVVHAVADHVDDPQRMRALGFCVSVEHAQFMADTFTGAGIRARAVSAATPGEERRQALQALGKGELKLLLAVDLFNEGVDLPLLDTLLLLRPTDSPVLFLQQLGRGLRRHRDKAACTVLDFIGLHRKEFRFERRLGALLRGSRKAMTQQIQQGFPYLPAGCTMHFDRVATDVVLENIRRQAASRWQAKAEELARMARECGEVSLKTFLDEACLAPEDVYSGTRSWSDLRQAAGLPIAAAGPHEATLRRAFGRLLHVDDLERIECWNTLAASAEPPDPVHMTAREQRLLRMLVASLMGQVLARETPLAEALPQLWQHPQVLAELAELMAVLHERVDHIHTALDDAPEVPLQVHAGYTRVEILAAFGVGEHALPPTWREGTRWVPEAQADLLAFTLDKTRGHFSPTTRYRDYAISRQQIHWESQSTTRAASPTGQRYRQHVKNGSAILLFARQSTEQRAFRFLGPARYVRHQSEQPMQIVWHLQHPLPGDVFAEFAAAVA